MTFNLIRNTDRYPDIPGSKAIGRWPDKVTVEGTLQQAQFVAERLSNYEAGCDYYWYVEGDEE